MDTTRRGDGFQSGGQDTGEIPAQYPPVMDEPDPFQEEAEQPDPDYPFEEPEQAPELRSQRSEHLYSRSEPFWERVVEVPRDGEAYPRDVCYWDHPEEISEDRILHVDSGRLQDKVKHVLGARATWIVLGVLAVTAALLFLLYSAFMTVKSITVVGNTSVPEKEIIALSQLEIGMNAMSIDDELVIERIERNRYLRCTLVDVSMDTVVLHVRERVPAVTIVQNGRLITLDDRGWVLEITDNLTAAADGLIAVQGLDVHHCALGQAVTLRTPSKLTVYTQLLVELKALGGLHLIVELDMTSMDSITLKTVDGFTIQMGNEGRIHEKVRAMLIVREVVLEKGYYGNTVGGTITVTDPTSPTYLKLDGQ